MAGRKRAALLAVLVLCVAATPAASAEKEYKNKYQTIEVTRFEIKGGVEFPVDYLLTMTEELVSQLQATGKFKEVLREGETPLAPAASGLRLVGTVTEYKPGSRAKRALIGFGAGKTKVVAHVKWLDRATGEVLFEDDVDGKVVLGGAIASESIGATRGLAKEVASATQKQFF